jgi:phosphatidylglycerol:prolipoprotein diacylglycerol transferase
VFPSLLTFGPVSVSLYGLFTASGALAGLFVLRRTAPRIGWPAKDALDLGFWLIVFGLIGSRLFYVIFHWSEFSGHFLRVFQYWQGGLMFQGAVGLASAFAYLQIRRSGASFWDRADAAAPCLALGQALGRLGCYSAGCCYGLLASPGWPLAAVFPPGSAAPPGVPLYPVQLMESLGLFILFGVLYTLVSRRRRPGRIFGLYLMAAGLLRAVMEQFRGDFRGTEIFGQAPTFYMAAGLFGLGLWGWQRAGRLRQPLPA